jgi:hypothetical protein
MDSLVQRLRAAAAHDGLGIGEAWNLLDEAADALTIQATTSANLHAIIAQRDEEIRRLERERDEARALLREVRPNGCDNLHHPKKDRHGIGERCPILARLDAAPGEE